jgi:hypothetical protein
LRERQSTKLKTARDDATTQRIDVVSITAIHQRRQETLPPAIAAR